MTAILTLTRYKTSHIFFALNAMGLFRPFLWLNKQFRFYRLLGCGRNGTFDLHPDWNQYGIFTISDSDQFERSLMDENYMMWKKLYYGKFVASWWKLFGVETWTVVLKPIMAHGQWGGEEVFAGLPAPSPINGPVAVLTRASIRIGKAKEFWRNVPPVEQQMGTAEGLIFSVGIGEMPVLRQSTFSIWKDLNTMKSFAYNMQQHREVIRKTREEKWYSEELFARFVPLQIAGTLNGVNYIEVMNATPI